MKQSRVEAATQGEGPSVLERFKARVLPEWMKRRLGRPAASEAISTDSRSWIPFDDQRFEPGFKPPDIMFGPDPCDPRVDGKSDPYREAVKEGRLGLTEEDLNKTVGELMTEMTGEEDWSDDELHRAVQEHIWPRVRVQGSQSDSQWR